MPEGNVLPQTTITEPRCDELRKSLKGIEDQCRSLKHDITQHGSNIDDQEAKCEVISNLTLAIRHIEDARMRIGKVMQYAFGDGVSCFDKKVSTSEAMAAFQKICEAADLYVTPTYFELEVRKIIGGVRASSQTQGRSSVTSLPRGV
jgi:hypothetical protein